MNTYTICFRFKGEKHVQKLEFDSVEDLHKYVLSTYKGANILSTHDHAEHPWLQDYWIAHQPREKTEL